MNMFLRLFVTYLFARFRPSCPPLGPCITPFVVLPTDLDVFRHMNNGVYFSIMDLGRVDMLLRSGLMRAMRQAGYHPIVAAETIRFRRPLKVFQRFVVETRVMGWDDKAFLMEQRFFTKSRRGVMDIVAEAVVRARFLSKRTPLSSSAFLAIIGQEHAEAPALPAWVAEWNARQAATRDVERVIGHSDTPPFAINREVDPSA